MDTLKIVASDTTITFIIQIKHVDSYFIVEHVDPAKQTPDLSTSPMLTTKFKNSSIKACVSYIQIQLFQFFVYMKSIRINNNSAKDMEFRVDITTYNTTIMIVDEILQQLCSSTLYEKTTILSSMNSIYPEGDVSCATTILGTCYTKLDHKADELRIKYVKLTQTYIQNILNETRMMLKDLLTLITVSNSFEQVNC